MKSKSEKLVITQKLTYRFKKLTKRVYDFRNKQDKEEATKLLLEILNMLKRYSKISVGLGNSNIKGTVTVQADPLREAVTHRFNFYRKKSHYVAWLKTEVKGKKTVRKDGSCVEIFGLLIKALRGAKVYEIVEGMLNEHAVKGSPTFVI